MAKVIISNMKQAVFRHGFFAALFGVVFIVLLLSAKNLISALRLDGLLPYGTHSELLLSILSSDGCMLALPVLCTLPYTTAFVDDINSGYIKIYLPRAGIGRYIVGKTVVCGISGGLSIMLGTIAGYTILILLFLPKEAVGRQAEELSLRVIEKLALVFATGAFWSQVGFLMASLTKSRYMAYAGPFVICYVLIILYERYFNKLYVFYPREWLNPSDKWVFGAWGVVLLLLIFTIAICSIFVLWARRKLVEE